MSTEQVKKAYQNHDTVAKYDAIRFKGFIKSIKNKNDWRALRRALKIVPRGATLLNIPCGTGRFFPELMALGYNMTATDVSPEMIDYAEKHYGHYNHRIKYHSADI